MTRIWVAVGLVGCSAPQTPDETTDPPTSSPSEVPETVPVEWGVQGRCSVSPTGDFRSFYAQGSATLVVGDTPREAALAEQIVGWYGGRIALEIKTAEQLTPLDREGPLWIVGTPSSNPLVGELNGALPVWFDDDRFTFAGYRWTERGHGVAMVHPSPFAPGVELLLFAGNSFEGVFALFTVFTGGEDVVAVRGRGQTQIRGALCRDGAVWTYKPNFVEDLRADWDAYTAPLASITSAHHEFRFAAGGAFDADRDWMPEWQDDRYLDAVAVLEVPALDFPIRTYLYEDAATKGAVTGVTGNAHSNDLNAEVHALYTPQGIYAVGAHEDVHVLAWYGIGPAGSTLLGEGTAVMVDGDWHGQDLDLWATARRAEDTLPSLRALIDDFWGAGGGGDIGYGAAGHFASWVVTAHGIDTLKALYLAEDLDAAFQADLGLTTAEVEADWVASIPD